MVLTLIINSSIIIRIIPSSIYFTYLSLGTLSRLFNRFHSCNKLI
nr:MAG TPA: hypothetical protein [Bacteriophage sp.]